MFNRKSIIIVMGLIVVVLIVITIVLGKKSATTPEKRAVQNDAPSLGVVHAPDNSLVYFDVASKTFYKISDKSKEELFKSSYQPFTVSYSKDRTKVMLLGDIQNPLRAINLIDFDTKKAYTLQSNIINAAFSPRGTQIVYHQNDTNNRTSSFYTSDIDGSNKEKFFETPYEENTTYLLRWVTDNTVYIIPVLEESAAQVSITKIDLGTKIGTVVAKGSYTDIRPNNDGSVIATTVYKRNDTDLSNLPLGVNENLDVTPGYYYLHLVDSNGNDVNVSIETELRNSYWKNDGSTLYVYGKYDNKFGIYKVSKTGKIEKNIQSFDKEQKITELSLGSNGEILVVNDGKLSLYYDK